MIERIEKLRWVIAIAFILVILACSKTWEFREENDYFSTLNLDSEYTQGIRYQQTDDDRTVGIGQRIYTPRHKWVDYTPGERPYSAVLYGDLQIRQQLDEEIYYTYGATVGVVGPAALGKEAQCNVHALLGQRCPVGWRSQLDNEPVFSLSTGLNATQAIRLYDIPIEDRSAIVANAGTLISGIEATKSYRYGYGPFFVAAGPIARLVLRDITLDGNTYQRSASVNKRHLVRGLQSEIGISIYTYEIAIAFDIQTREYSGQPHGYWYGGVIIRHK